MKKRLSALLAAAFLLCAAPLSLAGDSAYTDVRFPLVSSGREEGTVTLRFYPDRPGVPYMGFKAFMDLVGNASMAWEDAGDGRAVYTSAAGAGALVDAEKGTMDVDNWPLFHNPPLPYEGKAVGLKDSVCAFVRIRDVVYEGDPAPLHLDFAKYGLKLYAEEGDVYFPVCLVSSMMNEVSTWSAFWNGEKLFLDRYGAEMPSDFRESQMMRDALQGNVRAADAAAEARGELLFMFDHFFGHPGCSRLDAALKEKGLEQALTGGGAEALAGGLGSKVFSEYLSSLVNIFLWGLDDGHTGPISALELLRDMRGGAYPALAARVFPAVMPALQAAECSTRSLLMQDLVRVRQRIWGDEGYRKYGSTAIIRLDDFMPDEAGWAAYYAGTGDLPADSAGHTVRALRRAAADPDIKNILFDLTCNVGGSSDVLAFILGITTGVDRLYGIEKVTGQGFTVFYETDSDLNGVIDVHDREAVYSPYNYGVLTTRIAFSCGNLFPFMMQEGGAVLLGEATGGGSCCIQLCTLSDGTFFVMSSSQWQLTDAEGVSVEGGCRIDLPLGRTESMHRDTGFDAEDRSSFYDEAELDRLMNEWFAEEALAPAA